MSVCPSVCLSVSMRLGQQEGNERRQSLGSGPSRVVCLIHLIALQLAASSSSSIV